MKPRSLFSRFLFALIHFSGILAFGQELPPVVSYSPYQYSAGNQNWMISQDENDNFFFANDNGLLEFNGENWELYTVPNNSIVRSVMAVGDRVYTGGYMEAGYWVRNDFGLLEYNSIIKDFPNGIADGELFWDIEFLENLLVFRSFKGIYFYDPVKEEVTKLKIPSNKPVAGVFKVGNYLFFQLVGGGLFTLDKGEIHEVIPSSVIEGYVIRHLYGQRDELKLITGNAKFFKWIGQNLIEFNKGLAKEIKSTNIFSAVDLPNGDIVLGTVGGGIFKLNSEGNITDHFNQENILLNNTVLSLYLDNTSNIWAGLDFGLCFIDSDSNFRSYQDTNGRIGSVYSSLLIDGNLYLGTNQGLYLKKRGDHNFKLMDGTNGQVWSIQEIDGRIFCGHDTGTFLIQDTIAKKISDNLGTWLVKKLSDSVFVQGHYYGFSFLREENGTFRAGPLMDGFSHSTRNIERSPEKDVLWINSEHTGVFKVKLDDKFTQIETVENYRFPDSIWATSSMFRFRDTLYYSTKRNIYHYDDKRNEFNLNNELNNTVAGIGRISGKMINENDDKLWGFADGYFFYLSPSKITGTYNVESFYLEEEFGKIADGYENLSVLNDTDYLLGKANGYLLFNKLKQEEKQHDIRIDRVSYHSLGEPLQKASLKSDESFDYQQNNIAFQYTAPVYNKYNSALYSYRLLGLNDKWSNWETKAEANFNNLDFRDYQFEVRAKIGNEVTEPAIYNFKITKPFYLTNFAIGLYILFFLLIILLVHILNRKYHKRQIREKERLIKLNQLEAEKEIFKLQNEKLEQDMANKSRELVVSTMSLIKKNEFLTTIKEQLENTPENNKVNSVIKTIDRDISEGDEWEFFKKAFCTVDKDFFKDLKAYHPNLTSNDLKFCAYLRLNLSSKEIAPLLNISIKSVETKRYRLRKKMNLDRNSNLTDYILQI